MHCVSRRFPFQDKPQRAWPFLVSRRFSSLMRTPFQSKIATARSIKFVAMAICSVCTKILPLQYFETCFLQKSNRAFLPPVPDRMFVPVCFAASAASSGEAEFIPICRSSNPSMPAIAWRVITPISSNRSSLRSSGFHHPASSARQKLPDIEDTGEGSIDQYLRSE